MTVVKSRHRVGIKEKDELTQALRMKSWWLGHVFLYRTVKHMLLPFSIVLKGNRSKKQYMPFVLDAPLIFHSSPQVNFLFINLSFALKFRLKIEQNIRIGLLY